MKYIPIAPDQPLIENMQTNAAMADDYWIDQDGDIYTPRPGDHAAELADDWGIDYETALVFCNCD